MDTVVKKDTTPNEVYVKRYKDFIRLVRISKMLRNAKIIQYTHSK
ncbi:MAG: hypothetical protein V4506_07560 [Bacteroidota bacterium]